MKKVLITILFIITACFAQSAYAAVSTTYQDIDSANCTKTGSWTASGQVGYGRRQAMSTTSGTITWFEKTQIAPARVSVWVTVDEEGCDDANITLLTEHFKGDFDLSFSEGESGWREVAIVSVTGIGLTVELKSGTNGKTYASAIKVEYLDTQYKNLGKITQTYTDYVLFGKYATVGYKNNIKIKTDTMPLIEENDAYVSAKSVFKYLGEPVSVNDEKAEINIGTVTVSGKLNDTSYYVNGKVKNGTFLKIYNNTPVINITAIARELGKNVFVSKRGIVFISSEPINFDEKLDKKLLVDTLLCLQNE